MAFAEVRLDTGYIIYTTEGGPLYSTDIVVLNSGFEQRNQNWTLARGKWDYGGRALSGTELKSIIKFFRARKGSFEGFRFKDWADFQVVAGDGVLGTSGIGTGVPVYQLYKNYVSGSDTDQRMIRKPVAGTVVVQRNGSTVIAGAGAGNMALDTTTGLVTFVADASSSATSITPGATTTVVLTTNPGTLVAGNLLYLSGFTGADAALVNGIAHVINSVSGVGPYTFVLATVTTGKTITLGAGLGAKYPQASDALTWTGEFDVPVRFDTDQLKSRFDGANIPTPAQVGETFHYLEPLPIVEIRV